MARAAERLDLVLDRITFDVGVSFPPGTSRPGHADTHGVGPDNRLTFQACGTADVLPVRVDPLLHGHGSFGGSDDDGFQLRGSCNRNKFARRRSSVSIAHWLLSRLSQ